MKLTGTAVCNTINGTVTYSGPAAATKPLMQSAEVTDEADQEDLMDSAGEVVGFGIRNERLETTLEWFPSATDKSLATAKTALKLPAKNSVITLSGFDDADLNGDWIYRKGGKKSFSSSYAKLTLPIVKYTSSSLTASQLCAAVS